MGAACCVAARDVTLSNRCLGDKRCHVIGATANLSCQPSDGRVLNGRGDIKGRLDLDIENVSGGGTPVSFITPTSQKSPPYEAPVAGSLTPSDASSLSNHFTSVINPAGSPEISEAVSTRLPFSMSSPPFSAMRSDASGSNRQLIQPNTTPSRRPRRSPGHQLFRQISDSRILGLKSPNSSSFSEGRRPSFALSPIGNDPATGSRDRSSDGWSLRTFSELVASSRRERWSFDSEGFGSGHHHKISGSSSRFFNSPSIDLRTCGVCSKLLSERAPLGNEVPVVALLVCGHVYHVDCLESMTEDASKYDPACPVCTVGEKQVLKMSRKAMKAEAELKLRFHKKLKNRVMDSYLDNDIDCFEDEKNMSEQEEKVAQPCSSSKLSSGKPLLKRRFSLGSKWAQLTSETGSAKKRGFWGKYRGI